MARPRPAQLVEGQLRLARGSTVPWSDVLALEWTFDGALVSTRAGVFAVNRADGEAIEQHIAPHEAQLDAALNELPVKVVRGWNRIPSDVTVDHPVEAASMLRLIVVGILAVLACWLAFYVAQYSAVAGVTTAIVACLAGWLAWASGRRLRESHVQRTADSLRWRGKRPATLGWGDLRGAARQPVMTRNGPTAQTAMTLLTRFGRRHITAAQGGTGHLFEAIDGALAAREERRRQDGWRSRFFASAKRPGEGLWLDDLGLTEVTIEGSSFYPWAALSGLQWRADDVVVRAAGRAWKLADYADSEQLVQELERLQGGTELLQDAEGTLRSEVIERWLGVPSGGTLRCRLNPWLRLGVVAATVIAIAALLWMLIRLHGQGGQLIQVLIPLFALTYGALVGARAVDADAQGLSVRRGKRRDHYAWSDINRISPATGGWLIETAHGTVRLARAAHGSGRVVGIIRRLLAAKSRGLSLPTTAPLPETALSVARPQTAASSAALSVSGEPGAERLVVADEQESTTLSADA